MARSRRRYDDDSDYDRPAPRRQSAAAQGFGLGCGLIFGIIFAVVLVIGGIIAVCGFGLFRAAKDIDSELARQDSGKPAVAPQTKQPANDGSLLAMTDSAKIGDVHVSVTSVSLAKVRLKDVGRDSISDEPLLQVAVLLRNESAERKAHYDPWQPHFPGLNTHYASLSDNASNSYKRITFGLVTEVVGQVGDADSIYPGKSLQDLLVFEAPVQVADSLTLTLPASALGGKGDIRFRIPRSMWQKPD